MKYQKDEIKVYCKEQGLNLIHIVRDEGIEEMAKDMTPEQLKNTYLNVKLTHQGGVGIEYMQ
ncbi:MULTISPECIES: hypothetical protein [Priestia]|uniref:hypothetical protein n=1 Tax=Priestia TaxID=2800373 RepID=UPI001ADF59D7|nr:MULTISPECIES: hypothetical protein [Priestia]MBU8852517.1 hypothetical protein [Bacillus sp. FJAT-26377]MED5244913.1 hypothetical protein [Priestia sp. LL-8]